MTTIPTPELSEGNQQSKILLSPPDVGEVERDALLRAFDSGWVAPAGPEIAAFEQELADYVGAEACAALSSGTAALHLGLLSVGVKPGDRVVVQTATFAASAFAVVHAGAVPVFCDIEPDSWNLDPRLLEKWLDSLAPDEMPTAVMPVNLYGMLPDYAELQRVCERFGLPIVEDAAESLGSTFQGRNAATFGDVGVLSFNGNKIITTSGGGALVGDREIVEQVRFLSTQAREPALHYEHATIGYNYRMSNLLAALGRAQLSRLEQVIDRRTAIQAVYRSEFPELTWPDSPVVDRSNNWLSVALLPDHTDPSRVCQDLAAADIEARPMWKPMHSQPVFADSLAVGGEVAEDFYHRGICLPSGSVMTNADVERVVVALRAAV